MPIKIDLKRVPKDKLTDPDFLELYNGVQELFTSLEFVNSFCVHEAAHVIYYQRAGVPIDSVVGPKIAYDPLLQCFPAQVLVKRTDVENLGFNDEVVYKIAKVHAAGEIASLTLTSISCGGGKIDKQNFEDYCDLAGVSKDKGAEVWKQAEDEIRKEIQKPFGRKEAWREAFKIRLDLFDIPLPPGQGAQAFD